MPHLNITAIYCTITHAQYRYRQRVGTILPNRTADVIVTLMKLLKWGSRSPFRIYLTWSSRDLGLGLNFESVGLDLGLWY